MKQSCSGPVTRRTFLRAGALALGGLTLPDLWAARAIPPSPAGPSVMPPPPYLGLSHQEFHAGDPSSASYKPPTSALAGGVTPQQFSDRCGLLGDFDRLRRDIDRNGVLEGTDQLRTAALRVLTSSSMARAFDLSKEDPRLR